MKIAPANYLRTYEFIKRLNDYISFGVIAQKFGKEMQTAEAWARIPESNEHPFGTGKKNPIDAGLRVVALAHKEDAGLAREIAETFTDYVEYLDERRGISFAEAGGCVNELLGQSAKEHADIIVKMLSSGAPEIDGVLIEVKQAQAKLAELAACLKAKAKKEIRADVFEAAGGNRKRF